MIEKLTTEQRDHLGKAFPADTLIGEAGRKSLRIIDAQASKIVLQLTSLELAAEQLSAAYALLAETSQVFQLMARQDRTERIEPGTWRRVCELQGKIQTLAAPDSSKVGEGTPPD